MEYRAGRPHGQSKKISDLRVSSIAIGFGHRQSTAMQPTLASSREWLCASKIVAEYARSPLDAFKLWPSGKSYFFSPFGRCVIAYSTAGKVAIALGDPVGAESEIEMTVRAFLQECHTKRWEPVFYQTLPDLLPFYRQQGLRKLKIGDDAIVDLLQFSLEGK